MFLLLPVHISDLILHNDRMSFRLLFYSLNQTLLYFHLLIQALSAISILLIYKHFLLRHILLLYTGNFLCVNRGLLLLWLQHQMLPYQIHHVNLFHSMMLCFLPGIRLHLPSTLPMSFLHIHKSTFLSLLPSGYRSHYQDPFSLYQLHPAISYQQVLFLRT